MDFVEKDINIYNFVNFYPNNQSIFGFKLLLNIFLILLIVYKHFIHEKFIRYLFNL